MSDGPARPLLGLTLVVVGAHLSGQPLNPQLTARGAILVGPVSTTADYCLYLLDTQPPKPGLVRVEPGEGGRAIEAELWRLSPSALAALLVELPSPMVLGPVRLAGGGSSTGFLVEPVAVRGARDISDFGGWRNYLLGVRPLPAP